MDLRQLRHFLAVADTLHFGRAAERLGMTQPPLSQSIIALEREIGAPLFARSKRRVTLTPLGRQWLEHVQPAVEAVAALPDIAARLRSGMTGRVALAFVSTADYSVLPHLVRDFAAAHPVVELRLIEATSDVQVAALLDGPIDAGILIPPWPALPAALTYRPLLREPLIAAVPEGWIANHRIVPDRDMLADTAWMALPLVIFPAPVAPGFHELVLGFYRAHGREPAVRQEAIQMQTIIALVSAGIGMALVPASMRRLARGGVRYLALPANAPMLETGLAWRGDNTTAALSSLIAIAEAMEIEPAT